VTGVSECSLVCSRFGTAGGVESFCCSDAVLSFFPAEAILVVLTWGFEMLLRWLPVLSSDPRSPQKQAVSALHVPVRGEDVWFYLL